jgi:hypothetical protein
MSAREDVPQALRWSFDSLVLLITWDLWKERNRCTFDRRSTTPSEVTAAILEEAAAWIGASYGSLALLTGLVA